MWENKSDFFKLLLAQALVAWNYIRYENIMNMYYQTLKLPTVNKSIRTPLIFFLYIFQTIILKPIHVEF